MARDRIIIVGGLNIVTHPHSSHGYVELMRALFGLRLRVPVRGTQHLMVGELHNISKGDPLAGLYGVIYRFDHIDPNLPWFNVATHDVASDEDMAAVSIPENLKPNLVEFGFVFFPKTHSMFFVTRWGNHVLSPGSLLKLVEILVAQPAITKKFGQVEVTVVPDRQQLERIFSLHRLTSLTIDLIRPNPDDNDDDEEEVLRRYERQGVRRVTQHLVAEPGQSITPDDDTRLLARVAEHNGKVTAVGYTIDGKRTEDSTVDVPWREPVSYDPALQTSSSALIDFARHYRHAST